MTFKPIQSDRLIEAANPHAMHNSRKHFDPPKCHPGTREAILEHIMQWIFGSSDRDALILWLYGPAGAGKSAILQTIAEKCSALNIVLASFLFSRSDGTRNHPDSLIATIAYQIQSKIPQIAPILDTAIDRDPMIFDKTLDEQVYTLIVKPFQNLMQCGHFSYPTPHLILIDGLDECNDERHQRTMLHAIAGLCVNTASHLSFLFLVGQKPISKCYSIQIWLGYGTPSVLDNDYCTENRHLAIFG